MTITINSNNSIIIDGENTGLYVTQRASGTVVYSASHGGRNYKEHQMPQTRYSLAHTAPTSGAAGLGQFEADLRALIATQ